MLQGLKTFKEYSISVVAFNENGEGGRSDEIEARTLSDRPSDIPQNVTLEAASATVSLYLLFYLYVKPFKVHQPYSL